MNKYTCRISYIFPNGGDPTTVIQEGESVIDIVHHFLALGAAEHAESGDIVRVHVAHDRDIATIEDYDTMIEIKRTIDIELAKES